MIIPSGEIIKTHDIILLQKKCSEIDPAFSNIDFKNLNEFAVDVRYPDDFLTPALSEANEFLLMAERKFKLISEQ